MKWKIILAVVAWLLPAAGYAQYTQIQDVSVAAKKVMSSGMFDAARRNLAGCSWRSGDNYLQCREWVVAVVIGHAARKEYAAASKYLNILRQAMTAHGGRSPSACLSETVHFGKEFYSLGYEQTAYQIARAMKAQNADKLALKAFLCASFRSVNYKYKAVGSVDVPALSRQEFIATIRRIHGASPAFDVARYLDDVLNPVSKMWSNQNAKMMVLFKNAARRCDELGLDRAFGAFFKELAQEYYYYAKDNP
ncbi:hypothetical protein [Agrobacterium sp. NPDC089420]|uniref:hypothetical protein n=1 Tax=Agrobacterium sp. NPDC089420 TaxID=3363918 RepID=UPI00385045D5